MYYTQRKFLFQWIFVLLKFIYDLWLLLVAFYTYVRNLFLCSSLYLCIPLELEVEHVFVLEKDSIKSNVKVSR